MGKALEGIRVLDFTTMAAGPTAAAMLADYGADPLITELADKLRLKYPLLPTIHPKPKA